MRISGGIGKGRKLKSLAGSRVRPTSDKVKQALFNVLGGRIRNCFFLDLFAGAGGVGIEALSRGAGRVLFVDDSAVSVRIINENVEQSGFSGRAQVITSKAEHFLKKTGDRFDIVFLDPPYAVQQEPLLSLVANPGLLKPDSIVISEHFKKQKSPERAGCLVLYREAVYGDTVLAFYAVTAEVEPSRPA